MGSRIYDPTNTTLLYDLADVVDGAGQTHSPLGEGVQNQLNADGTGYTTVHTRHPHAQQLNMRRAVRFYEGESLRGVYQIAKLKQTIADPDDAALTVEASGPGLLARTTDALCYPRLDLSQRPIGLTRVFNWSTPGMDESQFTATVRQQPRIPDAENDTNPAGYTDPFAEWIWPEAPALSHTTGTAYMRRNFYLPSDALYVEYCTADGEFISCMDGFVLDQQTTTEQTGNWRFTWRQPIRLTAGWHTYAVAVTNDGGAAGFLGSGWTASEDGGVQTLITLTGELGTTPYPPAVEAVGTWLSTGVNPDPMPGWTAGKIIITLLGEAQARGALQGLQIDFTEVHDSEGHEWPVIPEFAFTVPCTIHDVLLALSEAWIDVGMADVGLVLRCWDKTYGRGGTSLLVLQPKVNLTRYSLTTEL